MPLLAGILIAIFREFRDLAPRGDARIKYFGRTGREPCVINVADRALLVKRNQVAQSHIICG